MVAGDDHALRWSVRAHGRSGFLFVNNYQRLHTLPPKNNVRFHLRWSDDDHGNPVESLDIPSNASAPLAVHRTPSNLVGHKISTGKRFRRSPALHLMR